MSHSPASLATLPVDLKLRILDELYEVHTGLQPYEAPTDGWSSYFRLPSRWSRLTRELGAIAMLSEVDREFRALCSPVLWRDVSLAHHSPESIQLFLDTVFPSHHTHIRSLTVPATGLANFDSLCARAVQECTNLTALRLYSPWDETLPGHEVVTETAPSAAPLMRTLEAVADMAQQLVYLSVFLSEELLAEPEHHAAIIRACTSLEHLELVGLTSLFRMPESLMQQANEAESARAQFSAAVSSLPSLTSLRLDFLPLDFLTFPSSSTSINTLDITLRAPPASPVILADIPLFRSLQTLTFSNLFPYAPLPFAPSSLPGLRVLTLRCDESFALDLSVFHPAPSLETLRLFSPSYDPVRRLSFLPAALLPFTATLRTVEFLGELSVEDFEENDAKAALDDLAAWCEARTIRFLPPIVEVLEPDYGYEGTCGCCCACCDKYGGYGEWEEDSWRGEEGWDRKEWDGIHVAADAEYDLSKGRGEWRRRWMRKDRQRWLRRRQGL
ncbi:hypothetical protein JCM6882_003604 [Rhodosporidiobolus microsporus]